MKKFKLFIENNELPILKAYHDIYDSYDSETFGRIIAAANSDWADGDWSQVFGILKFSIIKDEIIISDIDVAERARRKGVASNMISALINRVEYQDYKFSTTLQTEDGAKLFKKFPQINTETD